MIVQYPPVLASYVNWFSQIPIIGPFTEHFGQLLIPTTIVLFLFSFLMTIIPGVEASVVFRAVHRTRKAETGLLMSMGHNFFEAILFLGLIVIYLIMGPSRMGHFCFISRIYCHILPYNIIY